MPNCIGCQTRYHRSYLREGKCKPCWDFMVEEKKRIESMHPPAWLRPPKEPCSRCGGGDILRARHAVPFVHRAEWADDRLIRLFEVPQPPPEVGALEAYICRGCGLTELFSRAPDQIPISPLYGTDNLPEEEPPPSLGPYR